MKIAPTVVEYVGYNDKGKRVRVTYNDEIEAFVYMIEKHLENRRDEEHLNYIIKYLTNHHFYTCEGLLHYVDFYKNGRMTRTINKKFKKKEIKRIKEMLDITC